MELIERDSHLAVLAEHLGFAVAGHGRLVLVGGEAGVGKTSLVRAFAEEQAEKARIVWAACDGLFTPEPLAPLDELGAGASTGQAGRREVFAAVLDELGSRSTIAVVEDVHWADEATLDLLRHLGRRLDGRPALVIATYRDDETARKHALRLVLGDVESARRIALPPLTEDGVRALAEGSDVDAHELFRQTGGNPFFVTEVLAAGGPAYRRACAMRYSPAQPASTRRRAGSSMPRPSQAWRRTSAPRRDRRRAPARPRRVPRRRRAPEHRGTCRLSPRAGPSGRRGCDRPGPARRVPRPRPPRLSGSSDSARLAHHAEAAGDAPAVLEHARAAAERAAKRGAHREAAEQYARCLRFADDLPSEVIAELLERRSHECSVTLQVDENLSAGLAALDRYRELGDRLKEGELLSWSSRLLYWAARLEEAEDAAHEAVAVLEEFRLDGSWRWRTRTWQDSVLSRSTPRACIVWGERAIELAEQLGEDEIVVGATIAIGAAKSMRGNGRALSRRRSLLPKAHGTDEQIARVYSALVFHSVRNKNWPAADHWLEEGLAYTAERDLDDHRIYLLAWRADAALERGRWDDAAADARTALNHPHAVLHRTWALLELGYLRALRGDPGVWELLDEMSEVARHNPPQRQVPSPTRAGQSRLPRGRSRAGQK